MIRLSAQQLLDCDKKENGCKGGKLHTAYDYIARNGGIDSLENYPYKAEVGECKKDTVRYFSLPYLISFCEIPLLIYIYILFFFKSAVVRIRGWVSVLQFLGEGELKNAVSKQPVAIVVDAESRDFQLYERVRSFIMDTLTTL